MSIPLRNTLDTKADFFHMPNVAEVRRVSNSPANASAAPSGGAAPDPAPERTGPASFAFADLMKPWICVRHRAGLAPRAKLDIRRLGHDVFWPRYIHRERRRDDILKPLFPGYLFARCDPRREPWGGIRDAEGVIGVVGVKETGRPIPVPAALVQDMIDAAGSIDGAIDLFPEPFALRLAPRAGTPGRLAGSHPMAGLAARFDKVQAKDRFSVLADLMGVEVTVFVAPDQFEIAEKGGA
jgi:transcriptional antiterminator RfaH